MNRISWTVCLIITLQNTVHHKVLILLLGLKEEGSVAAPDTPASVTLLLSLFILQLSSAAQGFVSILAWLTERKSCPAVSLSLTVSLTLMPRREFLRGSNSFLFRSPVLSFLDRTSAGYTHIRSFIHKQVIAEELSLALYFMTDYVRPCL